MKRKVLLFSVDGLRPDAVLKINNPFVNNLLKNSYYSLKARTVFPSVTLPCHTSLMHSVDPARHGVTTNIYTPQVRPINGLFEQLKFKGKKTAMFYNWEELRDIRRPDSITISGYYSYHYLGGPKSTKYITDATIKTLSEEDIDFCFTYLVWSDGAGHDYGWMSEEYLRVVNESFNSIEKIMNTLGDEYIVIIVADHGGHDRGHGSMMDEDMTIPVIIYGKDLPKGEIPFDVSIKDIAPTIVNILSCDRALEWEGKSLL